ncbi:hypothetical protein [Campylobacter devanensis]|uniref:hypothetical protein n=1 Tax=Campylobacter devanensis TaxID=3161138 RepID=UPI000A33F458|nr:hypothetical protein [Campylobacter sp. P0023]
MYKEIFQIRGILKNNNINGYCVHLVNSGFGDILTNASAQSFICDLFDLKFQGIANKDIKTSFTFNNWYSSIIEDAGFCTYHNLKKLLIIEVDDILKDIVHIKSKINTMLENGGGMRLFASNLKDYFSRTLLMRYVMI